MRLIAKVLGFAATAVVESAATQSGLTTNTPAELGVPIGLLKLAATPSDQSMHFVAPIVAELAKMEPSE